MIERVCQQCGKQFLVKPSDIKYGRGKFCSMQCRGLAKRNRVLRTCLICGASFLAPASKAKKGEGKFCSNRCRFAYYQTTKVTRICLECGKLFTYRPSRGSDKGIFCSGKCQAAFRLNKPLSEQTKRLLSERASARLSVPQQNPMYGKHHRPETIAKLSKAQRNNWKDPEYVAMMMKQMSVRPTQPEEKLQRILDKHFPGQYKYTGDGKLVIYGMRPDFANCDGAKEVIEVFGSYWHSPKVTKEHWERTELGKIMAYNSLGYSCLVIWDYELEQLTEEAVVDKIKAFRGRKHERSAITSRF